ncbi:hypothetical protein ACHAXA_004840 [Cyclostephanos tholiformis]|uniref:HMG box domain-containing protein n=1 Tax=Cyclostephanos tholiformis TaxID=382380 RepID=A0ABD3SHH6_9STRA
MSTLPPRLSPDDVAALLERVDDEMESAREELRHAHGIAQAAGLTVHGSVLDVAHNGGGGGNNDDGVSMSASSSAAASALSGIGGDYKTSINDFFGGGFGAPIVMDLRREAALAVRARHRYNPLRGTLNAFPLVLATTAGHCNTDHVIRQNSDGTVDRLSEYRRTMRRRRRAMDADERGADRWDLPRIPGGRRRRLRRDADAPSAPPEPPMTGYVIYVSQMTTKLRRDNPDRHHDQISAVRRISMMWNRLSDAGRDHYVRLARDARSEYDERLLEYRATGGWSPYTVIQRLSTNRNGVVCRTSDERSTGSNGPWVRVPYDMKNELEREIDTYEQVIFPPRPAGSEGVHERIMSERRKRRRERIHEDCAKFNTPILS